MPRARAKPFRNSAGTVSDQPAKPASATTLPAAPEPQPLPPPPQAAASVAPAEPAQLGSPAPPAPPAPAPAGAVAAHEVRGMPADQLASLPLPPCLQLRRGDTEVYVAFGAVRYAALRSIRAIVLASNEWDALCVGAVNDRAGPQIDTWLDVKRSNPHTLLTPTVVLGGIQPDLAKPMVTVGQVLRAWGLRLEGVTCEEK